MRIARLAAALTAAGVLVLGGATAAFSTDETTPSPSITPTLTATPPEKPPEEIDFVADINPKVFQPGDELTISTTGCPTVPTVEDVDGLFTGPLELEEVGKLEHSGSATTKSDLPNDKSFHLIVTCEGAEPWVFISEPGKPIVKKPGGQTGVTPVGGVDTGDGSTAQGGGTVLPMAVSGAVVVLAAAVLGVAYRRRKAQEDA